MLIGPWALRWIEWARFAALKGFQKPWDDAIGQIIRLTDGCAALVDSTGVGDPILEMLQKKSSRFEGYNFTSASKQKLMEGLAVAIQSHTITFPDGPLRKELENFEYEYTRTGVRYSAPEGFHDDCVCSLSLAVMHNSASNYDSSLDWVGGPTPVEKKAVGDIRGSWRGMVP